MIRGETPPEGSAGQVGLTVATLGFSAAAVSPRPLLSAALATLATVGLMLALRSTGRRDIPKLVMVAGAGGLAVLLIGEYRSVGPFPPSAVEVNALWIVVTATACLSLILSERKPAFRNVAVVTALLSVVVVTAPMVAAEWGSGIGVDVYRNHLAAGEALRNAENPYGEAVQVEDGNPFAPEGSTIVGYAYPPVVLAAYGLAAIITDPRAISLIGWIGVLGWLVFRSSGRAPDAPASRAVLIALATMPVWALVWYAGWTEPMSLALFVGSALLWNKRPTASAIVLGLALASKQYFIFVAPLLLLHRGADRWRRAAIALGTAAMTLIPALLVDPTSFVTAIVGNLADIGFRPDTQSLSGLLYELGIDFHLPALIWVPIGLGFAILVGRNVTSASGFVLTSALTLAFAFLVGSAFPNYWFLVAGLVGAGLVLAAAERGEDEASSRSASAVTES